MTTETQVAKTRIVIKMKNGDFIGVDSPYDVSYLVDNMYKMLSSGEKTQMVGIGYLDINGDFVVFNVHEYSSIKFIPQVQDATP